MGRVFYVCATTYIVNIIIYKRPMILYLQNYIGNMGYFNKFNQSVVVVYLLVAIIDI